MSNKTERIGVRMTPTEVATIELAARVLGARGGVGGRGGTVQDYTKLVTCAASGVNIGKSIGADDTDFWGTLDEK